MRRGSSDKVGEKDEDRERRLHAAEPPLALTAEVGMTADHIRTKFRNFPAANLLAKIVSR
jgi:hypothetical protein